MEHKIPPGNYIGYLWYSDQNEPKRYNNGDGASIDLNAFPFIAEGMLWDESTKTSVMINYTHKLNLAVYQNVDVRQVQTYLGHKTDKNIKMTTIWAEVADELCAGLPVLKPKAKIFVGFE
jgi:CRISPR type III-associated protein (TIGR04423 family)